LKGQKNQVITLILSIACGLVGLLGIGHFYTKSIKSGILFLLAGIAILVIAVSFLTGLFLPYIDIYAQSLSNENNLRWHLTEFFFLLYLGLYLVQIYDSLRRCRRYNLPAGVFYNADTTTKIMSDKVLAFFAAVLVLSE
jgi:TM2 domain-containing membrane protein YozV